MKKHFPALVLLGSHACLFSIISFYTSVFPDGADHWVWSRKLFWGYLEHPPMVAIIPHFLEKIFPNASVFILKAIPIILWESAYFFLYMATCRHYKSNKSGIIFLIILLSSPYFFAVVLLYTINVYLFFFFSLFIYLLILFLEKEYQKKDGSKLLPLFGVVIGLAVLSKLLAIIFVVPFGVLLLILKKGRLLLNPFFYLMNIIVLIIASPYIYWNIETDWMSFKYQFERGTASESSFSLDLNALGLFLLGQLAYGIIFPLILWLRVVRPNRECSFSTKYMTTYAFLILIIPFSFFLFTSLKGGHTDIQWLSMSYAAGFIIITGKIAQNLTRNKKILLIISVLFSVGFVSIIISHILFRSLNGIINKEYDQSLEWIGWEKTGKDISRILVEHKANDREVVITRVYDLGGALSLYTDNNPYTYSLQKRQRNLWIKPTELPNKRIFLACFPDHCLKDITEASLIVKKPFKYIGRSLTPHPYNNEIIRTLDLYIPK